MFITSHTLPSTGRRVPGDPSTVASCRKRNGVTMVESLLVMVVLGTMTSIALPKMNESVRQRRVIAAASTLNADIPAAFSLAARQRKPITLSYNAASGELRVTDRATGTLYLRRPLRSTSEYMLDGVTLTPSSVELFPNGVASSAFTVQLQNGSFVRRLSVGRTGLTRVTTP